MRQVYDGVWDFPMHAGPLSMWIWAALTLVPAIVLLYSQLRGVRPPSARLASRGRHSERLYRGLIFAVIVVLFVVGIRMVAVGDDSRDVREQQMAEFLRSEGIVVSSPAMLPGIYPVTDLGIGVRLVEDDGSLGPEDNCLLSAYRKFSDGSWQSRMPRKREGGGRHVRIVITCPEYGPYGSR